jgi:hypothetical protein
MFFSSRPALFVSISTAMGLNNCKWINQYASVAPPQPQRQISAKYSYMYMYMQHNQTSRSRGPGGVNYDASQVIGTKGLGNRSVQCPLRLGAHFNSSETSLIGIVTKKTTGFPFFYHFGSRGDPIRTNLAEGKPSSLLGFLGPL